MNAVDRLRERNRADVTLGSGLKVGLELAPLRDALSAGILPIAAVDEVIKRRPDLADKPSAVMAEMEKHSDGPDWMAAQRQLVAKCVKSIDGEDVDLTPEDTSAFSDEEFFELVEYGMRIKPLPGKA